MTHQDSLELEHIAKFEQAINLAEGRIMEFAAPVFEHSLLDPTMDSIKDSVLRHFALMRHIRAQDLKEIRYLKQYIRAQNCSIKLQRYLDD